MLISNLQRKVFSLLTYESLSLMEIVKRFSNSFNMDWEKLRTHTHETSSTVAPLRAIYLIFKELDILATSKLAHMTGETFTDSFWKLGENAFKENTEITVQVPKTILRMYEQMARREKTSIDQKVNDSLLFFLSQNKYRDVTPVDLLISLIVRSFGSSWFIRDDLIADMKDLGIFYLLDNSLEAYCVGEEDPSDVQFLIKENGKYKLYAK